MQIKKPLELKNTSYDKTTKYYFDENPFLSYLLTAFMLNFPHGEKMFIEAIQAVMPKVNDSKLKEDVRAFIRQEMLHSREHDFFNQYVTSTYTVDVTKFTDEQVLRIKKAQSRLSEKHMLAITCGLEHLTAIVGAFLLQNPQHLRGLDSEVRKLVDWHSYEEVEHKAVAFDVYQNVFGDYWIRVFLMLLMTSTLLFHTFRATLSFLWADKVGFLSLQKNFVGIFKISLFLIALTPAYLSYFRFGFHPDQENNCI